VALRPGFRRVCLCRRIGKSELQRGTGAVKRPARAARYGFPRVKSGSAYPGPENDLALCALFGWISWLA
jgi:hypothetical protein